MSFDELVALKESINLAIWESEEWQEVTVPQGVYVVVESGSVIFTQPSLGFK